MKKFFSVLIVVVLIAAAGVMGCAKKAATTQEAIQSTDTLKTTQEKVDYLIAQAKAFYNSQDFQGAVQLAQHVLTNLDKDSQAAKQVILDARAKLEAAAKSAMQDMKNKLGVK